MTQRPQTMPETDAVGLLMRQHEEIRRLCRKVEANMGSRRADAFDRLRRLLAAHETAEEQIVHPLVRHAVPDGDAIVDARLDEERRGKRMLRDLERMGTDDPSFTRCRRVPRGRVNTPNARRSRSSPHSAGVDRRSCAGWRRPSRRPRPWRPPTLTREWSPR